MMNIINIIIEQIINDIIVQNFMAKIYKGEKKKKRMNFPNHKIKKKISIILTSKNDTTNNR